MEMERRPQGDSFVWICIVMVLMLLLVFAVVLAGNEKRDDAVKATLESAFPYKVEVFRNVADTEPEYVYYATDVAVEEVERFRTGPGYGVILRGFAEIRNGRITPWTSGYDGTLESTTDDLQYPDFDSRVRITFMGEVIFDNSRNHVLVDPKSFLMNPYHIESVR